MKRNNKKGFTIVELVIVIAVIGILAGVMIPVFGNVIADANAKAEASSAKAFYTQWLSENADDPDFDPADYVCNGENKYDVTNFSAPAGDCDCTTPHTDWLAK